MEFILFSSSWRPQWPGARVVIFHGLSSALLVVFSFACSSQSRYWFENITFTRVFRYLFTKGEEHWSCCSASLRCSFWLDRKTAFVNHFGLEKAFWFDGRVIHLDLGIVTLDETNSASWSSLWLSWASRRSDTCRSLLLWSFANWVPILSAVV